MKIIEMVAVMLASDRGEKIQVRHLTDASWADCSSPTWNWLTYEYRITPKPVEFWVRVKNGCLVSLYDGHEANCRAAVQAHGGRAILVREVTE